MRERQNLALHTKKIESAVRSTLAPMATEGLHNYDSTKSKQKISRKLDVDSEVEVRSRETGLQGSWHPGTVILCEDLQRHVRYNNILVENEVDYLEEVVIVSKALDGDIECANCYTRGYIRPLPPLVEFDKGDLIFGLCVDVNYEEAWWEGVIFDHCDGMDKRSVFFPDLGDEMQVGIHQIRITQDWDEISEEWTRRGNWVFLDLVEDLKAKLFVAVSVKQIWYDVRLKKEFEAIREWTCKLKYLWTGLIMDVVDHYLSVTIKEILSALNLPVSLLIEMPEQEFAEAMTNAGLSMTGHDSPFEQSREDGSSSHLRSTYWKAVKFSEVELCPDSVREYPLASKREVKAFWMEKLQKHLVCLGWKIEWSNRFNVKRYRYIAPHGHGQKSYLSLLEVCKAMKQDPNMNSLHLQSDRSIIHPTVDYHLSDVPANPAESIQNRDIFPLAVPSSPVEDEVEDEVEDGPEYCPQAVVQYYRLYKANKSRVDKKEWILKAKKHLLAEGWIFDHPPPFNKRRGIIYMSPQKRKFSTLHAACKYCIKESIPNWDLEWQAMDEGSHSCKSNTNQKKKNQRDSKANIPKCRSNGWPLQLLRSNKRVQKVSGPAHLHHKRLNIPSYLIDNKIILPRSKVYYKTKGRDRIVRTSAEGKITHVGIKCNCCLATYSFAGFENHAGGSSTCKPCKPSASIFLGDGRSLLDCQIEMMESHRTRKPSGKSINDMSLAENDYICSVCHYGGELILCDKCPSSFHNTCLGLEDIPEGDWFCPSCRCGICGQRKIDGDEVEHFLSCVQCERKYHVRCLKNGAADTSRYNGKWFCGKDCEKIYWGLHKLLGEPIPMADNLTWTLMKFIDPDSCDLGNIERDLLAESYCKLNLALSLMHECFEPLKESLTGRDIVEDAIFSRWSELNRINFQGFYTVLLEKDEELVSVATVRVHGNKVAEIPLVGTRLQYRRHGMCRILINELEKNLMQLDVERLVLPAVPSVLETWTGSFGFAKMTNYERSQFLNYTFLDFEDTILCQKWLIDIASSDSVPSPVCKVLQVEEITKEGMMDQQMEEICAGNNDDNVTSDIDLLTMVEQLSPGDQQCQNGRSSIVNDKLYKFVYTRRKIKKSC